jgi:hypothetical protein
MSFPLKHKKTVPRHNATTRHHNAFQVPSKIDTVDGLQLYKRIFIIYLEKGDSFIFMLQV